MGRDVSDNVWYDTDMAALHRPVPAYDLYGDADALPPLQFMHCETIRSRSQRYEWEIAPHVHPGLGQVLFVARGQVDLRLEGLHRALAGPRLVFVPSGLVHGFRFSPDVRGFVVTVAQPFLEGLARQDALRLALRRAAVHVPAQAATRQLLVLARELLRAEQLGLEPNGYLLQRALGEAWLRLAVAQIAGPAQAQGALVRRFEALVETSYRAHRPLGFYATQLNCTVRTLARQVKEQRGLTPMQLINRRLMLEARRLLRFTNARCAEVAAELGFEDPSYFSRFYRRMTGQCPNSEKAGVWNQEGDEAGELARLRPPGAKMLA